VPFYCPSDWARKHIPTPAQRRIQGMQPITMHDKMCMVCCTGGPVCPPGGRHADLPLPPG
jgi:hypothetical protein